MAKQTFEVHLYAKECTEFDKDFNQIRVTRHYVHGLPGLDFAGSYIGAFPVEVDVPEDFDIRAAMLRDKQTELEKVRGEFINRITQLQREINELQCIELEPQS